jgi:uncharacterized membrane protein YfcA
VGIGLSLGLIGGGGSVLAAPVLIYVMGVPTKTALAMTLVIVGVTSLIGVIPHWMQKNVNLRTVAFFAPPSNARSISWCADCGFSLCDFHNSV